MTVGLSSSRVSVRGGSHSIPGERAGRSVGIEHKEPTAATAKLLYGTAFICAFPECSQPLFRLDADGSTRHLNSQICHIAARREGGPRWDPDMNEGENRSAENLVLMCLPHAMEIDEPSWPDKYPTHLLRDWKQAQLDLTERIQRTWPLSDAEAEEVVRVSEGISIVADTLNLGGAGGVGLGAGGGGGGAIGQGAAGGPGGSGGQIRLGPGYATEQEALTSLKMFMDAAGDTGRGSGGGGMGEVGPGSVGGNGGDGADAFINREWFESGTYEILVGQRGDDTVVNHFGEDGVLQAQKIARSPGSTYMPYPPTTGRPLETHDLDAGFSVPALFLAETITVRRGMVDLLDALWQAYEFPSSPFRALWMLAVQVNPGALSVADPVELQVLVRDPEGKCRLREPFDVRGLEHGFGFELWRFLPLNFTGSIAGSWSIEVVSRSIVLRTVTVEITCPPSAEDDAGGGMVVIAVRHDPDMEAG